jgi:anionic cell wall polymer biosynthesis LytR-Cps2A-Psr (LCP) family protein
VIGAVKKSVVLSDNWDLAGFAAQMRGLNSGNVEFRTIPVSGPAVLGGADVMRVDPAQVHQFVDQLTSDPGATSSAPPTTATSTTATSTAPRSTGRSSVPPTTTPASTTPSTAPAITGGEVPCVN